MSIPRPHFIARDAPSPWFRARNAFVDLFIVHAMGERIKHEGKEIPARDWLHRMKWPAHDLVHPDGMIDPLVRWKFRAPHAGASKWGNRAGCNDYSIGVELLIAGAHDYVSLLAAMTDPASYTTAHYSAAAYLLVRATQETDLELDASVGHEDVAGDDVRGPGKGKRDPGSGFQWNRFLEWRDLWKEELIS